MGMLAKLADVLRSAPRDTSTGRNDPCWCGSGKKYKRCHMDLDRVKLRANRKTCVGS